MADPYPVNSPRRVLRFSRKRRDSGLCPKPTEVYGFIGSIITVVATAIIFIRAYFPEDWLHSVGLFYYPSRYWALAIPTYFVVTVVLALGYYIGLNFVATPPPTSLNLIYDEHSGEPQTFTLLSGKDDQPIEPVSDICIDQINELMFRDGNN